MPEKKECNCITEVAAKIKDKTGYSNREVKGYKIEDGRREHSSFYPFSRIYSLFIITSVFTKKDGTTSRPKKDTISIFYTYCPFCGQKFPTPKKIHETNND